MKNYSIGQFAKETNVSVQTLRNWDKAGKLKPNHVLASGHRYYTQQQLDYFLGLRVPENKQRLVIGYCRVSSHKQKDDLEHQVNLMETYLIQQGKPFEIIQDIGSGINYDKKGLNKLIDMVLSHKVEKVVILYKDRLLRFGYELLENIFEKYDTPIQIINHTEKTENQELVEDLIQIITVFSCRLQGKRANKAKKIIRELREDDFNEKS